MAPSLEALSSSPTALPLSDVARVPDFLAAMAGKAGAALALDLSELRALSAREDNARGMAGCVPAVTPLLARHGADALILRRGMAVIRTWSIVICNDQLSLLVCVDGAKGCSGAPG